MPKRAAPTDPAASKNVKTEHQSPEDFSNSVKRRLAGSTRTGQACDRCKVRKIRCDGKTGGCSPCAQNNTPCKTTDRITGRATTRGHTEYLEAQVNALKSHCQQLEAQLRGLGVDYKPFAYQQLTSDAASDQSLDVDGQAWNSDVAPDDAAQYSRESRTDVTPTRSVVDATISRNVLPVFKAGCVGENYLGVSSPDSVLSPVKGLSLSIFGVEFDLSEYIADDTNDELSANTYQRFIEVIYNKTSDVEKVPWPDYSEVEQYAIWYFRSVHPYCPMLFRPVFMNLLWRLYNEPGFQPTPSQTVQVHMVIAIMKYQIAGRNTVPQYYTEASRHYLYALTFVSDLIISHTLEDVQALTLVCVYLRNLPKPGPAWLVTSTVFMLAIEIGMHRSTKAWAEYAPPKSREEMESRKICFWSLYGLLVGLNGKLGRPMAIRVEDMDVELPEPANDTGRGAEMTSFSDCSYHIGIALATMSVHLAEMHSTVYAVKQSPQMYEQSVRKIEQDIKRWHDQTPPELTSDTSPDQERAVFVAYLQCWEQEIQLLLHHPSICRSTSPEFMARNMDYCLAAGKKLVSAVQTLRKLKALELTWINITTYLASIFTTLYIHSQRKDQLSSADLASLRNDMDSWLETMKEVGFYFGTGTRLYTAVQKIIDQSLDSLNAHLATKTVQATGPHPNASLTGVALPSRTPSATGFGASNTYNQGYTEPTTVPSSINLSKPTAYMTGQDTSVVLPPATNAYQSSPSHYHDTNNAAFHSTSTAGFDASMYQTTLADGANVAVEHVAAAAAAVSVTSLTNTQPTAHINGYMYTHPVQAVPYQAAAAVQIPNHNAAWREWTTQMFMNNVPQASYIPSTSTPPTQQQPQQQQHARMSSADALVALGATPGAIGNAGVKGQDWPQLIFDYRRNDET